MISESRVTLPYDQPIETDKTIATNQPDINYIYIGKINDSSCRIDLTEQLDNNTVAKETGKLLKYENREGDTPKFK